MPNTISTIFKFSEQGGGLKKFKSDIMSAEGATGKLKAGWSNATTAIKQNAGTLAVAGGAALAAFGAKAVKEFTNGAIAAGEFSAATGVTTEEASKWISAAGDIGISGDLVQKAFQKANKEVAEGGPIMDQYGISVVRAADGSVSANETFLKTIDIVNGIKDPTEKARVAQELFGRSYGDIAELIFQDADKVRAALESTSEQQVFDEDEVRKAREYREAMDRLADSAQDVLLVVGEGVTPAVTQLANAIADVDAALDDLPLPGSGGIGKIFDIGSAPLKAMSSYNDAVTGFVGNIFGAEKGQSKWVDKVVQTVKVTIAAKETATDYTKAQNLVTESIDAATEAADRKTKSTSELTDAEAYAESLAKRHNQVIADQAKEYWKLKGATEGQAEAVDNLIGKNAELIGGDIAVRNAQREATQAMEDFNDEADDQQAEIDRVVDAQLDAAVAARDHKVAQREAAGEMLSARQKSQLLAAELTTLANGMQNGPIKAALLQYIDDLNRIPRNVDTTLRLNVTGAKVTLSGNSIDTNRNKGGPRAAGGPTDAAHLYPVGEGGKPELYEENGKHYLIPGDNGQVTPAKAGDTSIGGATFNITVNAGLGANGGDIGREIIETIRRFERFNGKGWRT